ACLSVAMICVSVNFDVRMEPPDLGTMPERSTYAVSADRGSLRLDCGILGSHYTWLVQVLFIFI
ncbi:hypothetical protein WH212_16140, partial [Xanthomonas perforans]|uniref:hypothetical protein n=1 Tax=Xanthomonas perforans TaxID=442694 RepID=UPI00321C1656